MKQDIAMRHGDRMTLEQEQQVRQCLRLMSNGHMADYLRGAGYAEAAILEAEKRRKA